MKLRASYILLVLLSPVLIAAGPCGGKKGPSGTMAPPEAQTIASLLQLTTAPGYDGQPSFAPADETNTISELVYTADAGLGTQLMVISARGTASRRLVTFSTGSSVDASPDFDPAGRRIAFCSDRLDGRFNIWVVNSDGSGLTQLTQFSTGAFDPQWSPDGKRIVFHALGATGTAELYLVNADGSGLTTLGPGWSACWRPDGKEIAFARTAPQGGVNIWTMTPEGGNVTQITAERTQQWRPAWSPDGNALAYVSRPSGVAPKELKGVSDTQVWLREKDERGEWSKAAQQITFTQGINDNPDWAPDGKAIAFESNRGGNVDIWVAELKVRANLGPLPGGTPERPSVVVPPWQ